MMLSCIIEAINIMSFDNISEFLVNLRDMQFFCLVPMNSIFGFV